MATVYEKMRAIRYPVWIWGAGSMAQAVADRLQAHGIATAGYFVDVEDFRDETGGRKVLSLRALEQQGQDISVVVGHGHPEKAEQILQNPIVKQVFVIDHPYPQYVPRKENLAKIETCVSTPAFLDAMYDEASLRCLHHWLDFHKGLLKEEFYRGARPLLDNLFGFAPLKISEHERYVDAGAWDGDTVKEFLSATQGKVEKVFAFEPGDDGYQRLSSTFAGDERVACYQYALGSASGYASVAKGGGTQSMHLAMDGNSGSIPVVSLDEVLLDREPTIIKVSVPFLFCDVLKGASRLMETLRPRFIVDIIWDDGSSFIPAVQRFLQAGQGYRIAFRYRLAMPTQLWLYAF